jgi:S-adenosylmethionine:tRNA ribosyltransferase-isomerase
MSDEKGVQKEKGAEGASELKIVERKEDLFLCHTAHPIKALLNRFGHVPLPPYITRPAETSDRERYQTVYAKYAGSVAAPTAGLHFDEATLEHLQEKGVQIAYVTLHVGSGTFKPVRSDMIHDHKMHSEQYSLDADLCQAVNTAKAKGNRVIAVGTTSLRSLESAALKNKELAPCVHSTDLFITPGFEFKMCDGLITNFHLPESTLLMLVSAFIGHQQAMALYQEAIAEGYRFFSYGDTSLLL